MEHHQLIEPTALAGRRGRDTTCGWAPSLVAASCCFYLVVVTALALGALLPPLFGVSATTIVSGSMRPAVNTGDVVLAGPAINVADLGVGDVVTFRDPEHDRLVTHRIVEVLDDGRFRTRGDANRDIDRIPISAEHIVARPILLIPMAGLPAHWLTSGAYAHAAAWLAITAAAVATICSRRYRPKHRKRPPVIRRLAPTIAAVALVAAALQAQQPASAAFTGTAGNLNNTITAATIDAPTGLSGTPGCTLLLVPKVTLSWTADTDATSHTIWRSTSPGGSATKLGTTANTTFTDGTVLAGSTYYYKVTSSAVSWTSAPSTETKVAVGLSCL